MQILVPLPNYRAQVWSDETQKFVDVKSDVLEQRHLNKNGTYFTDFKIYVASKIQPNQVALVKLVKTEQSQIVKNVSQAQLEQQPTSTLTVQGYTDNGQILFNYTNPEQGFEQSFGVNLKKYYGHQKRAMRFDREHLRSEHWTLNETFNQEKSEGAYAFLPEWDDAAPKLFGQIGQEVSYQKGELIEQWTSVFEDKASDERGILVVRFAPQYWNELIEFEVLLNPIPIDDNKGKDVTVNWQFFNGFDPKGQFWTDSNALGMVKRELVHINTGMAQLDAPGTVNYKTYSGNYYPVDSAIVMKDLSNQTNLEVTVMNDRPQGGSVDLTEKATIELMQQRRLLWDDDNGVGESLNETEADGTAIQSNAKYYMQIFDSVKANSSQRQAQIK